MLSAPSARQGSASGGGELQGLQDGAAVKPELAPRTPWHRWSPPRCCCCCCWHRCDCGRGCRRDGRGLPRGPSCCRHGSHVCCCERRHCCRRCCCRGLGHRYHPAAAASLAATAALPPLPAQRGRRCGCQRHILLGPEQGGGANRGGENRDTCTTALAQGPAAGPHHPTTRRWRVLDPGAQGPDIGPDVEELVAAALLIHKRLQGQQRRRLGGVGRVQGVPQTAELACASAPTSALWSHPPACSPLPRPPAHPTCLLSSYDAGRWSTRYQPNAPISYRTCGAKCVVSGTSCGRGDAQAAAGSADAAGEPVLVCWCARLGSYRLGRRSLGLHAANPASERQRCARRDDEESCVLIAQLRVNVVGEAQPAADVQPRLL